MRFLVDQSVEAHRRVLTYQWSHTWGS